MATHYVAGAGSEIPTKGTIKMLSATLAVNLQEIDQMQIVRIDGEVGGPCRYRCRIGYRSWEVDHDYDDGAWRLVQIAIEAMPPAANYNPAIDN